MEVEGFKQAFADAFAGSAGFEQHVVRQEPVGVTAGPSNRSIPNSGARVNDRANVIPDPFQFRKGQGGLEAKVKISSGDDLTHHYQAIGACGC